MHIHMGKVAWQWEFILVLYYNTHFNFCGSDCIVIPKEFSGILSVPRVWSKNGKGYWQDLWCQIWNTFSAWWEYDGPFWPLIVSVLSSFFSIKSLGMTETRLEISFFVVYGQFATTQKTWWGITASFASRTPLTSVRHVLGKYHLHSSRSQVWPWSDGSEETNASHPIALLNPFIFGLRR